MPRRAGLLAGVTPITHDVAAAADVDTPAAGGATRAWIGMGGRGGLDVNTSTGGAVFTNGVNVLAELRVIEHEVIGLLVLLTWALISTISRAFIS